MDVDIDEYLFDKDDLIASNVYVLPSSSYTHSVPFKKLNVYDSSGNRTFTITDYPINVPNAWAYPLFELDDTRVVVNITPIEKI